MVDGASHMFVTGPDGIEAVTGEGTTAEELGGARTRNSVNGNTHFLAADEGDALDTARDPLSYLPANNLERPLVLGYGGGERAGGQQHRRRGAAPCTSCARGCARRELPLLRLVFMAGP